jgi:hypothetical protein
VLFVSLDIVLLLLFDDPLTAWYCWSHPSAPSTHPFAKISLSGTVANGAVAPSDASWCVATAALYSTPAVANNVARMSIIVAARSHVLTTAARSGLPASSFAARALHAARLRLFFVSASAFFAVLSTSFAASIATLVAAACTRASAVAAATAALNVSSPAAVAARKIPCRERYAGFTTVISWFTDWQPAPLLKFHISFVSPHDSAGINS